MSQGSSDESIKSPSTRNTFLGPSSNYVATKTRVTFSGSCLKQDKITYTRLVFFHM